MLTTRVCLMSICGSWASHSLMAKKQQTKRSSRPVPVSTSEGDALAARIGDILEKKRVRFEVKRMMGGLCFKVADKMCFGTAKNLLMVRFDPVLHDEVLSRPGAAPMDFTGRAMRGYVFVKPAVLNTESALTSWIDLGLDFNPRAKRSKRRPAARTAARGSR